MEVTRSLVWPSSAHLAAVISRMTAMSKSQTSPKVLGSNWLPRRKKRRVSKDTAMVFTMLVVRRLALTLREVEKI